MKGSEVMRQYTELNEVKNFEKKNFFLFRIRMYFGVKKTNLRSKMSYLNFFEKKVKNIREKITNEKNDMHIRNQHQKRIQNKQNTKVVMNHPVYIFRFSLFYMYL